MSQERLDEIEQLLRVAEDQLSYVENQRQFLLDQIASLKRERESLLRPTIGELRSQYSVGRVSNHSSEEVKIALFRSLFRGREDVYARRFESSRTGKSGYQPDCRNEWLPGICPKPKMKCSHCDQRQFIPISDAVIRSHLPGRNPEAVDNRDFTIGIYPLLPDETCWFLAVDLDKSDWKEDAKHDMGVLVAPTAFGKTVVAAWLIARRGVNTLVLVHTRQLLDQWLNRLDRFLKPPPGTLGQIGAGKKQETGLVDIAIMQSLIHRQSANPVVERYGQIIVDECHHISARSFEQVARAAKAFYVTGFSATVERKDGHHPIIFMQCGPIRHRVTVKQQQITDHIKRTVYVRNTGFTLPDELARLGSLTIHDVYEALIRDESRNQMIVSDALSCLEKGGCPLILTERRTHLECLLQRLAPVVSNLIVLTGGMGQKQRKLAVSNLQQEGARLVLATGRYLGEGFDDDRLDTLFLALPISWKGTLAQYAGRLNRIRREKQQITIFDYADPHVPMLRRMFERRRRGYRQLGYEIVDEQARVCIADIGSGSIHAPKLESPA